MSGRTFSQNPHKWGKSQQIKLEVTDTATEVQSSAELSQSLNHLVYTFSKKKINVKTT